MPYERASNEFDSKSQQSPQPIKNGHTFFTLQNVKYTNTLKMLKGEVISKSSVRSIFSGKDPLNLRLPNAPPSQAPE